MHKRHRGLEVPGRSVRGDKQLGRRYGKRTSEATKSASRAKRIAGMSGVPSRWSNGEGHVGIEVLEHNDVGLPGVGEGGMPGRDEQRKLGTTRGSPRRSRTAKASRISRHAVKSR